MYQYTDASKEKSVEQGNPPALETRSNAILTELVNTSNT